MVMIIETEFVPYLSVCNDVIHVRGGFARNLSKRKPDEN